MNDKEIRTGLPLPVKRVILPNCPYHIVNKRGSEYPTNLHGFKALSRLSTAEGLRYRTPRPCEANRHVQIQMALSVGGGSRICPETSQSSPGNCASPGVKLCEEERDK